MVLTSSIRPPADSSSPRVLYLDEMTRHDHQKHNEKGGHTGINGWESQKPTEEHENAYSGGVGSRPALNAAVRGLNT